MESRKTKEVPKSICSKNLLNVFNKYWAAANLQEPRETDLRKNLKSKISCQASFNNWKQYSTYTVEIFSDFSDIDLKNEFPSSLCELEIFY